MSKHSHILSGAALLGLIAMQPLSLLASPSNLGPPIGPLLDLAGQPIPTSYTNYTATFTAVSANTDLLFALRHDPGFFGLDDISMVDNTTGSNSNLVVNGGFETGNLTGWTDENIYGASFAGVVGNGIGCVPSPRSGSFNWCDGSVQAYDAIDQNIATTIGHSYTVSFWLNSIGQNVGNFQDLSLNGDVTDTGGNGIDVLVFAQGQLPAPSGTPEPVSMLLFGSGLAGIGLLGRRYAKKA